MSKNTDTQNLLVNVFRPVYTYETPAGGSTPVFTSKIILTNIDTVYANTIAATNYQVGDSNNNLYLGCNAGNTADNTNACTNVVGIGASAASNVSNVSNSTYLGTAAGAGATNASNVIAIGTSANGNGVNNVYIGNATGNIGSNNIFIGHSNAPSGTVNNTLRVGKTLIGDLSNNKLGVGLSPTYELDVSGTTRVSSNLGVGMTPCNVHALDVSGYTYISGGVGINADPLDHTLSVNGDLYVSDGNARYYFKQDPSQNSVFTVESLDPSKKAIFVIRGDISADNLNLNSITYSNLTISGTMKSADVSATSVRVQDIVANTFTAATFGSIDLSAQTLTATHVNALSDISAAVVNAGSLNIASLATTDISASTIKGTDVSGSTGRFNTLIGTDISGSTGRITTLFVNDITASSSVTVPTISTSGDISSSGTVYGTTLVGTDVSGTTGRFGTLFTNGNTSNRISGITLSNGTLVATDLSGTTTRTGTLFTNPNTSNNVGGVTLSNGLVSATTVFGTDVSGTTGRFGTLYTNPTTLNKVGGITLSNNDISLSGTIIGSTANTSNVIGGIVLSNTNIRIGLPASTVRQAYTEIGGGYGAFGTSATRSAPAITFQYGDAVVGGYRHFIRTRHDTGTLSVNNAVDIFTNNSAGSEDASGATANTRLAMSVTSAGVGVGTDAPAFNLDVSGNIRSTTNTSNSIGGVTLSNTNLSLAGTITGSTANTSNVIGGVVLSNNNISNSGTHTSSNFVGTATASNSIGGTLLSNSFVGIGTTVFSNYRLAIKGTGGSNGYIVFHNSGNDVPYMGIGYDQALDALTVRRNDASANLTTTTLTILRTGNVGIGLTNPAYNLDVSGNVRSTATSSNSIGNVTLSNGLASATTVFGTDVSGTTARFGTLFANPNTSNNIGGVTLSNTNLTLAGTITGSTANTSNSIGGIILSNSRVGVGVAAPAYSVDITATVGTPAINMNTWPRVPVSNVSIVKNPNGYVGNTVIWSNVIQSINSNLATVDISGGGTSGCSFVIKKSGIWAISYSIYSATAGVNTWIDVCANNVSSNNFMANGVYPIGAIAQNQGGHVQYNWTGYLASNTNYYKIRATATTVAPIYPYYFMLSFLGEVDTNLSVPI